MNMAAQKAQSARRCGLNRNLQSAGLHAEAYEHAAIGKKIPIGELVSVLKWWWNTELNLKLLLQ